MSISILAGGARLGAGRTARILCWLVLALLGPLPLATAVRPGDFDAARDRLVTQLLEDLWELSEWCGENKLFGQRADVYRLILDLDEDHEDARKALGYKRDRKTGEWQEPRSRRAPRDHNEEALPELRTRRASLIDEAAARWYALIEGYQDELPPHRQRQALAELAPLAAHSDALRTLLGEMKVGDRWVLPETPRAERRRAEIAGLLQRAATELPAPQPVEPDERERAFGLSWTVACATPAIRVLGTGTQREAERVAQVLSLAQSLFDSVMRSDARYRVDATAFLLARPGESAAFLGNHPRIDDDYRRFLEKVEGAGIINTGDVAYWAPDEPRRLDGVTRLSLAWLFSQAFGITSQHGWVMEGFGLYLTHELTGTRLTWFVQPSKYLRPDQEKELRDKLLRPGADWLAEARERMLAEARPRLGFVMGKNVNSLMTEDLLVAYAAAAYLLEGRPDETPKLLARIGSGVASQEAVQEVLGMDAVQLEERIERWLGERQ